MKKLHGFTVEEGVNYIEDSQLLSLSKLEFMRIYVGYDIACTSAYAYDIYKRGRLKDLLAEMLPEDKSYGDLMEEEDGDMLDRYNYRKKALELVEERLETVNKMIGGKDSDEQLR